MCEWVTSVISLGVTAKLLAATVFISGPDAAENNGNRSDTVCDRCTVHYYLLRCCLTVGCRLMVSAYSIFSLIYCPAVFLVFISLTTFGKLHAVTPAGWILYYNIPSEISLISPYVRFRCSSHLFRSRVRDPAPHNLSYHWFISF